jgi:hypothetical protein
MPNGKLHDNPLSDFTIHGREPFPPDIMGLLQRINELGREAGLFPLGEHWPYSPREFDWEKGRDLEGARRDLRRLLEFMEAGRAEDILVDPLTGRTLAEK